MEIKLQCGDSITIPDGCKAVVKDGSVVFEKEEKVQNFKDGDILVSVENGKRHNAFIYKGTDNVGYHAYYVGINNDKHLVTNNTLNSRWGNSDLTYATEEEKQLLFDKMKEQGLQWNAEEKRVETIRWRAKGKEIYYYVGCNMEVYKFSPSTSEDEEDDFNSYNYFRIKEQAEEAARRMKEVLFQYHEEMGE